MEDMEVTLANKNILVTGGTGFVGSHLIEALVQKGANVVTTYISQHPKSYYSLQGLDKKVISQHVDITNYSSVLDLVTKYHIEYIFHLAAQAIVDVGYTNPLQTLATNMMGTANILETCRNYKNIKGIIIASSDKAYGDLTKQKYRETDALQGDHPYDVSKSVTDMLAHTYFKTYGVPAVTTRFGNIYGEGDLNLSRLIPGIMESLIRKHKLTLRSDGTYIRDYLYVKDVVSGYLLLMKHIDSVKGEAFNFGSQETLSVVDVIKEIEETLQRKITYTIENTARNEIPYQSLSYTKINRLLGWKPQYSLKNMVKNIYTFYENIL